MQRGRSPDFHPPTSDQVTAYLQRHALTLPSPWKQWTPLLVITGAVILLLAVNSQFMLLLVWLGLMAMIGTAVIRARAMRQIQKQMQRIEESSLGREYVTALRLIWKLIPQVRSQPQMHTRAVALLAHNLQHVQAFDASVVAFDHIIKRLPAEHPAAIQFKLEQAMAMLASDQLADGDSLVRSLRYLPEKYPNTVLSGGYELALLYQQTRTNHFADMLPRADEAIARLRPLGLEAGRGYAMLALAFWTMRETDASYESQARQWWSRATLLLAPEELVARHDELRPLVDALKRRDASAGGEA